jgi:hypothetical protein
MKASAIERTVIIHSNHTYGGLPVPILVDHPRYAGLFEQYGVPDKDMNILAGTESVKGRFGRAFSARFSVHEAGRMRHDLEQLGRPVLPYPGACGFMAHYGKNLDRYLVTMEGGCADIWTLDSQGRSGPSAIP